MEGFGDRIRDDEEVDRWARRGAFVVEDHPDYPDHLITANVEAARKGKVLSPWRSASKLGDGAAPAIVGVALLAMEWNEIFGVFGLVAVVYAAVLFVLLGGFDTEPTDQAAPNAATDDGGAERDNRTYVYPMLAVSAYFVLFIAAAGGVNVFLPEFVTSKDGYAFTVLGVSLTAESTTSFYYAAAQLVAAVAQFGTGALVDRFDERRVIVAYVVTASGALSVLALSELSPVALFLVLGLLGAALWGMNPARDALVSEIASVDRGGQTFGYVWTVALLASAQTPAVVGYIGDVAGLRAAFLLLMGVVLVSAVPLVVLGERPRVPTGRRGSRAGRRGLTARSPTVSRTSPRRSRRQRSST